MNKTLRVEVIAERRFWRDAVGVEWTATHPERALAPLSPGVYTIEAGWLDDLRQVAARCFAEIRVAPEDPGRRQLFRRFIARG